MIDNKKLASTILEMVGGKDNIAYLVHCLTRLRFNLKDQSLAKQKEINEIEGVIGTTVQNGQLQVIIGQNVPDVYEEICNIANLEKKEGIDENLDVVDKKGNGIGGIFEIISGCFAPVVAAFAGAGVLKGLLTLLTTYKIISNATGIYIVLNAAADSTFYFLPFLLAYTCAKKFKTNEVMSLIIAGIYMYPTIINNAGTQINVLGLNIYLVKYASTVVPIMLSVWVLSHLHKFLSRNTPSYLRVIVVPLMELLIMAPLSLMLFGPIGYNVGIYIGQAFKFLFDVAPILGGFVAGFARPLIVFTGTHMTLSPVMINNIETLGYDMLGPVHCVATMSAAGMCFGAFLKAKNVVNKSANFSSFISAFIGITEPALYGVAFRFKKPLVALCIGGGVSGAFVAALGAKAISFAMPSIISLPVYTGSIPTMLVGMAIGFALTAFLTYLFGFDEEIEKNQKAIDAEKKNII